MVRIAGFPRAQERNLARLAGQYHQCCRFANGDPSTVAAKRFAQGRGEGFQAVEAVDRHSAQAVGPADDGDVHQTGVDQASTADDRPCAGGAGGRDGIRRAVQRKPAGEKARRIAQLLLRILPLRTALAVLRAAHVLITLVQSGGAGAQHHRHAVAPHARNGRIDGGPDLRQRRQQQLVVATSMRRKRPGDRGKITLYPAQHGLG